MANSIIVVEDNADLRDFIKDKLLDSGYSVKGVNDGVVALRLIKKSPSDLVILDLGLPTMGGETVCAEIKKMYPDIPIIILTAKGTTDDIVKGLNLGADDYISKPFEMVELLARVKAHLRAHNTTDDSRLKVGDLEMDTKTVEVTRKGKKIKLTPQEFKLLHYLMSNQGKVLTRDMILNRIWIYSYDIETRVVDVYMGYLRKKIDASFNKKLLHSIRGFGYMIKE